MSTSYSRVIVVSNTPGAAYLALTTGFDMWWTSSCNPISKPGDRITFRFGSTSWVMRANSLVIDNYVELECIEAHHVHEGLPSILNEWEVTKLQWQIKQRGDETKIIFVHEGLVPSLDCYDVCRQGWDYFFIDSLKQYLDTGKGSPYEH